MSYLNAQPGFLNSEKRPQGNAAGPEPPRSNFLVRFWREEITAPEKQAGNLAVAWAAGIALVGVAAIRLVGKDLLVPAF